MRKLCVPWRLSGIFCGCLGIAFAAGAGNALSHVLPVPIDAMTEAQRVELEEQISRVASSVANGQSFFERDMRPITIRASLNMETRTLYFDMAEQFGVEAGYTGMSDLEQSVNIALEPLMEKVPGIHGKSWRFGGKDIDYWMPVPKE